LHFRTLRQLANQLLLPLDGLMHKTLNINLVVYPFFLGQHLCIGKVFRGDHHCRSSYQPAPNHCALSNSSFVRGLDECFRPLFAMVIPPLRFFCLARKLRNFLHLTHRAYPLAGNTPTASSVVRQKQSRRGFDHREGLSQDQEYALLLSLLLLLLAPLHLQPRILAPACNR